MSVSTVRWVVVVGYTDSGPELVHGPYRTRETADKQAERLNVVAERYAAQRVQETVEQAAQGYNAHSPDAMTIEVLPLVGGPIAVSGYDV